MTVTRIAVCATQPERLAEAQQLAERLQLDIIPANEPKVAASYDYLLILTPSFIGLQKTAEKKPNPFYIDFLTGKLAYRSQQAGLRNELLARAMGSKPGDHPRIVDATAGLGRDSFILATLGFDVIMLERSPIVSILLQDALFRAKNEINLENTIKRMHLHQTDAISWLNEHKMQNDQPDVIYIDPMFPDRKKSASVKKEMVTLQELLGSDTDSQTLFETALTCAKRRVVVKRPRLAANIAERAPSFTLSGKSSRFDIYLV